MSNRLEKLGNAEVVGASVQIIIQSMGRVKDMGLKILQENDVNINVPLDGWVNLSSFIRSLEQIGTKFGPNTLYMIGKTVPEIIQFPPMINGFESAMGSINISYLNSHRNIDKTYPYYSFKKEGERKASVHCDNPYPSEFDRGLITGLARKFPPKNISGPMDAHLDRGKPTRKEGANSCTFVMTW